MGKTTKHAQNNQIDNIDIPTIVYIVPGNYPMAGGTYDYTAVGSIDELQTKLFYGWSLTLQDAIVEHNKRIASWGTAKGS